MAFRAPLNNSRSRHNNYRLICLMLLLFVLLPMAIANAHGDKSLVPAAGTYLGGSNIDGWADTPILQAPDGTVYVTASSNSPNLPATPGAFQETHAGVQDLFIVHFDTDLTTILAATYLGGSSSDARWPGVDMILGSDGSIYVASVSYSTNYPITEGAYDSTIAGGFDVVVSKLSSDLDQLLASTYLGGSSEEGYVKLAQSSNGNIYVTCATKSSGFPTTNGAFDSRYNGNHDVGISCLTPDLSTLIASTYLGSSVGDYPEAITCDSSGNVFVAGWTQSANFPTTSGAFMTAGGGGSYHAFVSCLNANLTTLVSSTFVSGNGWEFIYDVILDENEDVYVCGHTASTDFPGTAGAAQSEYAGATGAGTGDDQFVAWLSNDLSTLYGATYLGGTLWENAVELQLTEDGIYVGGSTNSQNWPTTAGAFATTASTGTSAWANDVTLSLLSRDLTELRASTYMGGNKTDCLCGMFTANNGEIYFAGGTDSTDFPTGDFAYDSDFNGGSFDWGGDVIIIRLSADLSGSFVSPVNEPLPQTTFKIFGASPNPFNPCTTFRFFVAEPQQLEISVYDTAGQLVKKLANQHFETGNQSINWDGRDNTGRSAAAGAYLLSLSSKTGRLTHKVILVK